MNMNVSVNVNEKKRITADGEAQRYLDRQLALKDKSRGANLLLAVLTLGFVFVFAVLFWVLPDSDFSADENRTLETFPEFTAESFFSGKFTDAFSDYMADQFPARGVFVGIKAVAETAQLKGENNDVIIADDGYLVARNDYPDEKILEKNLTAAGNFISAASENGISCFAAFAGRKADTCDVYLPKLYGSLYSDRIWGITDELCKDNGFEMINLRDPLRRLAADGESVYYKNDHHWTSLGAYYAYREIITAMGDTPYELSDFTRETVTDSFFGTTWSSSGVKWAKGDTIDYYRWDGDDSFTMKVIDKGGELADCEGVSYETDGDGTFAVFDSYYVRDFLSEKDKYASFIGGNFGLTKITQNGGGERETIMVLKDSFSHSCVQFLARHYDLVMVDLRYYKSSVYQYCKDNGIDKVLFLYNMETLTEGSYLNALNLGLGK